MIPRSSGYGKGWREIQNHCHEIAMMFIFLSIICCDKNDRPRLYQCKSFISFNSSCRYLLIIPFRLTPSGLQEESRANRRAKRIVGLMGCQPQYAPRRSAKGKASRHPRRPTLLQQREVLAIPLPQVSAPTGKQRPHYALIVVKQVRLVEPMGCFVTMSLDSVFTSTSTNIERSSTW